MQPPARGEAAGGHGRQKRRWQRHLDSLLDRISATSLRKASSRGPCAMVFFPPLHRLGLRRGAEPLSASLERFEADRRRLLCSFAAWAEEAPLEDLCEEAYATSSAMQQLILLSKQEDVMP
jgi:hypothetical protein